MSATTPAPAAARSKKRPLMVAVVIVAAVAAYWFFMIRPSNAEADAKPVPGEVITLEPVTVNLAGGGYLKVGLALQMAEGDGGHGGGGDASGTGAKALDIAIAEFSNADPSDVTLKREQIKTELEKKIKEAYPHEVLDIYFTAYVTQ